MERRREKEKERKRGGDSRSKKRQERRGREGETVRPHSYEKLHMNSNRKPMTEGNTSVTERATAT